MDRVVRAVALQDLREAVFYAHPQPAWPGGHVRVGQRVHHRLGRLREGLELTCEPALLGLKSSTGMVCDGSHQVRWSPHRQEVAGAVEWMKAGDGYLRAVADVMQPRR